MNKLLISVIFLILLLENGPNAVEFRVELDSPGGPHKIIPGQPFSIRVFITNDDRELSTWTTPFRFYSTSGDINLVAPGTYDVAPEFQAIWNVHIFEITESWDGDLFTSNPYPPGLIGDHYGFSGITFLGCYCPSPELLAFTFNFEIQAINPLDSNYGQFCVDSSDLNYGPENISYDWLFYPPIPFHGPYCWDVGYPRIIGQLYVQDYIVGNGQKLGYFEFQLYNRDNMQSLITDTAEYDGYFDTVIPFTTSQLYIYINSLQEDPLFSVYGDYAFPMALSDLYPTSITGETDDFFLYTIDTANGDGIAPYKCSKAIRIIKDLYITDSIFQHYNESIDHINIYVEDRDRSEWYSSGPHIIMAYQDFWRYAVSHEIGHELFYELQNYEMSPVTPYNGQEHYLNMVSDSIFAFSEGWAEFIRAISLYDPYIYPNSSQNYESNEWWMGLGPVYNDSGEIVEGAVASMLFDLFDDSTTPGIGAYTDDDSVSNADYMIPKILQCISAYSNNIDSNNTRSFNTFARRLVRDSGTSWYDSEYFNSLRDPICEIFRIHHYIAAIENVNFCDRGNWIDDERDGITILPKCLHVSPNRPNPFNISTQMTVSMPEPGDGILYVLNIAGQKLLEHNYEDLKIGDNIITLDSKIFRDISSGVYLYKFECDYGTAAGKMVLLK